MLIGQMSDQHLANTIRLHLRGITKAKEIMKNPVMSDPMIAAFHPQVEPKALQEKAIKTLRFLVEKLQPYLMEVYTRPDLLAPIGEDLRQAFGRTGAMPKIDILDLLDTPAMLCGSMDELVEHQVFYGEEEF